MVDSAYTDENNVKKILNAQNNRLTIKKEYSGNSLEFQVEREVNPEILGIPALTSSILAGFNTGSANADEYNEKRVKAISAIENVDITIAKLAGINLKSEGGNATISQKTANSDGSVTNYYKIASDNPEDAAQKYAEELQKIKSEPREMDKFKAELKKREIAAEFAKHPENDVHSELEPHHGLSNIALNKQNPNKSIV